MKRISLFFLSFFVLLFVFSVFLLTTESGLVLIQKTVNRLSGGVVSIGRVEGRLLGDLALNDIWLAGAGADIGVERLDYSWSPGRLLKAELHIARLNVTGVVIALKDEPENQPATDVVELPSALLPITVLVKSLVVNKLRIVGSDGAELFIIDKFIAGLEGNADRLTVREFNLQGPEIEMTLHGNIEVQRNWSLDMLGSWQLVESAELAEFGFHPMAGTFSVSGPLMDPHLELGIHSPGIIQVSADLVNLLETPEWRAKVEAKDVDLSTFIEDCPKIVLAAVTGDLTGNFESYRGHVQAEGSWDTLEGMQLVSDITGNFLGIDFESLRIEAEESSAEVEGGKISWRDIFSWEGRFRFKNFDPSVISEELRGRLSAELVSVGDVKENGVVASFEIFSLEGVLRDHMVSATGKVFLTETDVHTDGLTIRSGEVAGLAHIENGLFSWADKLSWSGKIRLDKFDPSWLYPEFPGSINGEFEGEGELGDNGLEGSLNIKRISGTLRGNELSGGGEITLSEDTLNTTGLVLKSGMSELLVHGRAGDDLALDFSLSSPDIGSFLPKGKGNMLLRGSLQGSRKKPRLDAKLQGAGLSYGENSLGRAQAEIHAGLSEDGPLTGSLVAEKISLGGYSIDKGRVELKGTLARHQIVVDGSGTKGKLAFKAQGSYRDGWQGDLSHFRLDALEYGVWQQESKTALKAARDNVLLERFCLANGESTVCLDGEVRLEKELLWKVHGNLASVPLQWLNRLELLTVPVNGLINADIAANGDSSHVLSAKVESSVPAADVLVSVKDTEPVPLQFMASTLTLELSNALLQGNFNVRMRNGSQVVLVAEIEGVGGFSAPMLSLPLRGNLELKEFDLSSLSAFTGYGVEPTGWVSSTFTLAGTVGQPKIYGEISVRDGGIDLPYQGIVLSNIELSIEAGWEVVQVRGTATSGPGKLTAAGTVQYGTEGIEGELTIQGKDFLLVNLPEYAIRVNPDLLLTFSKDKGELKGTVDVPYGLITPEEMRDSISASEDVVLVSDIEEERLNGWPFNLNVNVRLGDDVRIDGYGLAGRLVGESRVTTTQGDSLAGRGKLDLVEGTFTIYGRSLNIKRGRVLFTGGPIDNPGIDVRAQVKVSDEEARGEGYTVGVDISGLVQDLQYHLFSDPFMEDTEILSLMIVGHSLADSTQTEGNILEAAAVMLGVKGSSGFVQGIGNLLQLDDLHLEGSSTKEDMSLVLGKRVTKYMYIGYDLNMFNQLGQFRVRYDLTRGFSVETTSSSESTGADLLYTFER
jgi:translocation and assembly module TamB